MSAGDTLQFDHMRAPALRARLAAIADGRGTFEEHHQAGVLLSALADSAWWLRGREWRSDAGRLLNFAIDEFAAAREKLPRNNTVAEAGLQSDEAMARARAYRLSPDPANITTAIIWLENARLRLSAEMGYMPSDNPTAWHQMAISTSLLSQVSWGLVLGFGEVSGERHAITLATEASSLFKNERASSPDGERAYRSHLMTLALAAQMAGNRQLWRQSARAAVVSAQMRGDWRHQLRALAILTAGRFGDRHIRVLHEARAIQTLP